MGLLFLHCLASVPQAKGTVACLGQNASNRWDHPYLSSVFRSWQRPHSFDDGRRPVAQLIAPPRSAESKSRPFKFQVPANSLAVSVFGFSRPGCVEATPKESSWVVSCQRMNDLIANTKTGAPECQTLDINDAATELGVCKETVRRLVRRRVLRKLPGLRCILIPRAEIHRYLNAH